MVRRKMIALINMRFNEMTRIGSRGIRRLTEEDVLTIVDEILYIKARKNNGNIQKSNRA